MGLVFHSAEFVETGWDDDTSYRQSEERSSGLSNGLVEELLGAAETTEEETHSEDEEEVGEDTADEGGLDDEDFVVGESDDCDDHFDGVSGTVSGISLREEMITYPKEAFKRPPKLSPT